MTDITEDNICQIDQIDNSIYTNIDDNPNIKNNLCKPMLKSLCINNYNNEAYDYYKKCIDNDGNRNEFKDINNIKYKYDKIKQQNIDNNLRKKSNELFNYLIIFFIVLLSIIIIAIIKFLKF